MKRRLVIYEAEVPPSSFLNLGYDQISLSLLTFPSERLAWCFYLWASPQDFPMETSSIVPTRTFTIIDEKTLGDESRSSPQNTKHTWGKRIIILRDFSAPKENMLYSRYSSWNEISDKMKRVYSSIIPQGF